MTETISTESPKPCHATRWLAATIFCLILLAIGAATGISMFEQFKAQVAHLQSKLKSLPQIKYMAVLLDEKHAPAQLATFDPLDGYVQIQRLNEVTEGREQSLQLWALDESGQALSLGVVAPKLKTSQIRVSEKIFAQAKALVISVENKGGAEPGRKPNLPYLFSGTVIQKAL